MQYNSKDNSVSTWFSGLKDKIVFIKKEAKDLFKSFEDNELSDEISKMFGEDGKLDTKLFNNFINDNNINDEDLKNFLKDVNYYEKTLKNFRLYLKDIKLGISEEAKGLFSSFEDDNLTNKISEMFGENGKIDSNAFQDFIKSNNLADESLMNFLQDADFAEKTLENYRLYLEQTTQATNGFTSFTQRAGTILKSVGATLASAAISFAISTALNFAIEKISDWIHAAEIAKKKADEFSKSIKTSRENYF